LPILPGAADDQTAAPETTCCRGDNPAANYRARAESREPGGGR
jgi:hypothetical protein